MDGKASGEHALRALPKTTLGETRVYNGVRTSAGTKTPCLGDPLLTWKTFKNKLKDGFISNVILRKKNPKTSEVTTLPEIRFPSSHKQLAAKPTAVEARHFAAAYALYRVCNMRNLHMMMPPVYRDLWKNEFSQFKTIDISEGRGWMYEADPFHALEERNAAAADAQKKLALRERQKERDQAGPSQGGVSLSTSRGSHDKDIGRWRQAQKVEMGTKVRQDVERFVRKHAIWNPYGIQIPQPKKEQFTEELCGLGFRRSHVEEAIDCCKDREEALEWLLIHVPEDDLPAWSLPENYSAGISLGSTDLAREGRIKRLAMTGYSPDLCAEVLDAHESNEGYAAEHLQNMLLGSDPSSLEGTQGFDSADSDLWKEEVVTLEAIYAERFKSTSPEACEVTSEISSLPSKVIYIFRRPTIAPYPKLPPILCISGKGIPSYIRLSAVRQAIKHANEYLLGDQMIYNLIEWLEENLPRILENPGKLGVVSTEALSHAGTAQKRSPKENTISRTPGKSAPRKLDWKQDSPRSLEIRRAWESRHSSATQQKMLAARKSLPAWNVQDAILNAVNSHQVTIISGETGSGKSTQSVQFILDDMIRQGFGAAANLLCTQPRRISALGLADRVSDERCGKVGDEVGYTIRGDSQMKFGTTKINFMTTGVLLRRMQTSAEDIVSSLADVSHVIVDEVHERSLDTDFLLALLRAVLRRRKDLRLVLMSATLDAHIFLGYFGGAEKVGQVSISGRAFPVEDVYLDDIIRATGFDNPFGSSGGGDIDEHDEAPKEGSTKDTTVAGIIQTLGGGINYELISSTVQYIDSKYSGKAGGILIFLSGTLEIDRCLEAVSKHAFVHALPLHASLTPQEQKRVFGQPPAGKRKVIAATNVAETSITIDDIVAVIDTGRVKETRYDSLSNMVILDEVWASRAACQQRRGRAGRVQSGQCYKLYTRKAEQKNMPERPEPEIRRVPLEQLCLSVKAMSGIRDVTTFLANTITPPESQAIEGAICLLHRIGALDQDRLTSLGRYLSLIPADLRIAKLLTYGAIFGCVESCLSIAAILTVKSPFLSPRDKKEEANESRASFSSGNGDVLTDLNAYQQWTERVKSSGFYKTKPWCADNFLSLATLRDISSNRSQLLSSLKDIGILPIRYLPSSSSRWNKNDDDNQLLRALIAASLTPQFANIRFPDRKFASSASGAIEVDPEARMIKYFNEENGRVFVHPSSTLFSAQTFSGNAAFVSYFNKLATSKVFIRDLTRKCSPGYHLILLFVLIAFGLRIVRYNDTLLYILLTHHAISIQRILPSSILRIDNAGHTRPRCHR